MHEIFLIEKSASRTFVCNCSAPCSYKRKSIQNRLTALQVLTVSAVNALILNRHIPFIIRLWMSLFKYTEITKFNSYFLFRSSEDFYRPMIPIHTNIFSVMNDLACFLLCLYNSGYAKFHNTGSTAGIQFFDHPCCWFMSRHGSGVKMTCPSVASLSAGKDQNLSPDICSEFTVCLLINMYFGRFYQRYAEGRFL